MASEYEDRELGVTEKRQNEAKLLMVLIISTL